MKRSFFMKTAGDAPDGWDKETFVLREELAAVDDESVFEVLRLMYEHRPEEEWSVPLYQIIWTHLATPYPDKGALLDLVPLAQRLMTHITENNVDELIVDSQLPEVYVAVAKDVCTQLDCKLSCQNEQSGVEQVVEWAKKTARIFRQAGLLLLDQLLSLVLPKDYSPNGRPISVFPYPDRFDSTLPIAEALDGDANCLIPRLRLQFYWSSLNLDYEPDVCSYQNYITLGIIRRELRVLGEIVNPVGRDEMVASLLPLFKREYGVALPNTVQTATRVVFEQNIRSLMYFCWAVDYFENTDVNAAVIGGPNPRDFAILEAAQRKDVDTYYVHHSTVTGTEFLPPSDTTYFVPSKIGVNHIKRIYDGGDIPELLEIGRPYFEVAYDVNSLGTPNKLEETTPFTVLIATQPFEDDVRSEFLKTILEACMESNLVDEIKIKTHPDETPEFYQRQVDQLADCDYVTMASDDLGREIKDASLLMTINSNVGLEAMLNGTPTVCYNSWYPAIQNKPYARAPQVPLLKTNEALSEFVSEQTPKSVTALASEQREFAHEQFLLEESAADAIAEVIRARSLNQ
ncbi:hypothetical protein [Halobaculum magnesiiphilum]|uniref:Capsule polysaccharide biosynthesis protein n=1 Tax=Halobaculum magnesiiphilum TaxID=1017351 RepID=A0A8T8WEF5_9EURY|nr:hypothetical protein [Halobaculum magnesiiphilum]QZP38240.1 hypothetical protein K6T50_03535 [Halobaculum magnesiiphilum]